MTTALFLMVLGVVVMVLSLIAAGFDLDCAVRQFQVRTGERSHLDSLDVCH